ncbi:MAG: hypothetical protein WC987_02435 [Mariniphaga sp.]
MKKVLTIFILLLLTGAVVQAQEQQIVPYTLADRDRFIRLEAEMGSLRNEMNSLRNEMNARLDSQQKQIDDLKTLFFWGFSITITLIIFLLGYTIWDRRTALKLALTQAEEANNKARNQTTILREYARTHPDLAEILKTYGLL